MRYYLIVDIVATSILTRAIQTDVKNLRRRIDGTKYILKFSTINGAIPDEFARDTLYDHSQILTEMAKPEWIVEES